MTKDQIREVAEVQPFRRFAIHLADGRKIEVLHQEFLWLPPTGELVIVSKQNGGLNILDTSMITAVELAKQ